jgi:cytochrome c
MVWLAAGLVLLGSVAASPRLLAQDNLYTPRPRRSMTQLEPNYRKSVLQGWKLFQSGYADDNMTCANCHLGHDVMKPWAAAFPKVSVFDDNTLFVKTLHQMVLEALNRHTDMTEAEIAEAADPLVSYISWWGDGQPIRPGYSEDVPPAVSDMRKLSRCQQKGKDIALSVEKQGCGRCHADLGGSTLASDVVQAVRTFPRYVPALGKVASFDTFLKEHARDNGFWLGEHEITQLSAFISLLAQGQPLEPGLAAGKDLAP